MGGGLIYTGNSPSFAAATPRFSTAAVRSFNTPTSVAAIRSESKPGSQSIGDGVFGSVPSRAEVENAIVDLQRFMHGLSTSKPELDGLSQHELKLLQTTGFVKFRDAFSKMENEPALRDLIVSLSCDKAIWEAILSNKAVQDLQGSISAAKKEKLLSYGEESDITTILLKWIMAFTKSKILELIEKFVLLVNEIFQPAPKEKPTSELNDLLEDKVRSSFLLSVIILLIVVFTRIQE
ncbi:hypothetical protein CDL12_18936 [Handroanthus impetiginosus]|uniref:Uncharacterized protein n=1 Tax=Handroanthus impetiginosus TaxID=429701 RepID=A0A2G9GTA7_9LAMI|nr:hypothetical protein CDL12_18936 [Handroanthus impetiginosus]